MSTPVFNEVSPQVYALSTLSETSLTAYWAGYFVYSGAGLGSAASTTQVWQDTSGFYLFLDAVPSDWTVFSAELNAILPSLGPSNQLRIVWIDQAAQAMSNWQIRTAQASFSGSGSSIAWTLKRAVSFLNGNFVFSLNGQSPLTYISDANGGGIGFSGNGSFNGPAGGYPFNGAQIPFSGATLGAFCTQLPIPLSANSNLPDVWTALQIGLQYAAAPGTLPYATVQEGDTDLGMAYGNATQILFMPVFNSPGSAFTLELLYDPLNLLTPDRTALNLFSQGQGTPPVFESTLRTTNGYTVTLTPLEANQAIPSARFAFGACPMQGSDASGGVSYHLSPDGAFQLNIQAPVGVSAGSTAQIMLGLSGLEYANLSSGSYMLVFESGCEAFIPAVDPDQAIAPDVSEALTSIATTSHLTVMSLTNAVTNPVYFAQPREAPVFSGKNHRADNILDFNAMPSFGITYQVAERPPVFPVGFYSGLDTSMAALARLFENASLAPYRAYCLSEAYGMGYFNQNRQLPMLATRRERAPDDPLGVTPQGLVAELTPDYTAFDGLIIGNIPGTNYPTVDLTAVAGGFKEALQSNQLFFVASNVTELMSGTSVRYYLANTPEQQAVLLALGVPQSNVTAVYAALANASQPFNTESDFVNCIGTVAGAYLPQFLYVAGILKVEMDGWTFQLSPRSWRTSKDSPTLLIAKFCNRSLLDLANDTSSWAWPEVATPAGGNIGQTQSPLLNLLNAAGAVDASAPLRLFYETVVTNPNWNGFLFLNAPVDIGEFPNDLKFLTAGINLTQFYAHHIGFSQTPFHIESGAPALEQTAAFGLIDYEDKQDLSAEESIPFGFKTMRLRVRFANAALVDFSAEVELMLNQLLGASLSKNEAARGNNLIIDGSYQRVGGTPAYAFTLVGQNLFNANNTVLTQVEILSVQLITGGDTSGVNVLTTFMLMGNFQFVMFEPFDLYSFGNNPNDPSDNGFLRFSGLSIDMSFSMLTPTEQTFTLRENNTSFDQNISQQRKNSLLNNFPLTVSSLIASPNLSGNGETPSGQTPADLGYTSISADLAQTPMVPTWYGLVFTLDLGTFGALTGNQGFKISILAAWSRGASQNDIPVYLGLKLPGISAIGGSFPLQGVLKLGFRSFQFETYDSSNEENGIVVNTTSYLLRMHRFALSVLVWSFPPGTSDIVLFGQPGNPRGSLGWYASYSDGKDDNNNSKSNSSLGKSVKGSPINPPMNTVQRRLRSGRRKPPMS